MLKICFQFNQIQVRENEVKELEQLMEAIPCDVKVGTSVRRFTFRGVIVFQGGTDTSAGKVNILLQAYISGYRPVDFALVSDQSYAAQNAGRIVRALLEIAISKKWATVSAVLMGLSKAIEKRLWPFDQPLKQFPLKADVFFNLERFADEYTVSELASMSAAELGELVHLNERHGAAIRDAAKKFPTAEITYSLRPLGPDVLKIAVRLKRAFTWDSKIHGSVEPFWLWVEDHDSATIFQLSHLVFRQSSDALDVDFIVAIPDGKPPPFVTVRFVSDRWMGAEEEIEVPLEELVMPTSTDCHSPRLDIPFLPLQVLQHQVLQDVYARKLTTLNALQSQIYWSLACTRLHALVCAPTGSGKSVVGQLAIWYVPGEVDLIRIVLNTPRYRKTLQHAAKGSWILIIAPRRSILTEAAAELRPVAQVMGVKVDILYPEFDFGAPPGLSIKLVTAADLLAILTLHPPSRHSDSLATLRMVVCENLELLDAPYELGVSVLIHATQRHPTRYLGFSSSLNDPADLAAWLNVDPSALHSFKPTDRDQHLATSTHTFTIPQSAALYKAMAKPAHAAIQAAPREAAIIFVASRGQCHSVGMDLMTQCALEMETAKGYLRDEISTDALDLYLARLQDRSLVDFITRGLGFYHAGLSRQDRTLILEMYADGVIRVLIVPHDSCWTLPVRAATVVVMGTQYLHVSGNGEERQLRDYSLEELVRMEGRAVRHNGGGHFYLFCQAEAMVTFMRFLGNGLPLESKLLGTDDLRTWYRKTRSAGIIRTKQDGVDALSFTFFSRRLESNPAYYDSMGTSTNERLSRIVDDLDATT